MNGRDSARPATSAAALWRPLARFIAGEAKLGAWAAKRPATGFFYEFLRFGVKEAWGAFFSSLTGDKFTCCITRTKQQHSQRRG
jgi:hypothetical protein